MLKVGQYKQAGLALHPCRAQQPPASLPPPSCCSLWKNQETHEWDLWPVRGKKSSKTKWTKFWKSLRSTYQVLKTNNITFKGAIIVSYWQWITWLLCLVNRAARIHEATENYYQSVAWLLKDYYRLSALCFGLTGTDQIISNLPITISVCFCVRLAMK